ncbi:YceD family protein [Pseudorhodoplanes sp.]|uniref:YceD family protein n=1 Tax=Pseudorhodoplanes sp. TaxID=1934341 RepID=UPI00391BB138
MEPDSIWSRRIALADVPDEGLHVALTADAETRAALARAAGLRALPRLQANFDLRKTGISCLHVQGEILATVGQNCVVTLEDIENTLHEPVDLIFESDRSGQPEGEDQETSFAFTDVDPPEPLVGGAVDLGAIATEYFLLGIDPYPRKHGAVFEGGEPDSSAESPFAALAALKRPPAEGS